MQNIKLTKNEDLYLVFADYFAKNFENSGSSFGLRIDLRWW